MNKENSRKKRTKKIFQNKNDIKVLYSDKLCI